MNLTWANRGKIAVSLFVFDFLFGLHNLDNHVHPISSSSSLGRRRVSSTVRVSYTSEIYRPSQANPTSQRLTDQSKPTTARRELSTCCWQKRRTLILFIPLFFLSTRLKFKLITWNRNHVRSSKSMFEVMKLNQLAFLLVFISLLAIPRGRCQGEDFHQSSTGQGTARLVRTVQASDRGRLHHS